jgi:outer membrane protein TolC
MGTFYIRKCCWIFGIIVLIPSAFVYAQKKSITLSELVTASKLFYPNIQQKRALVNSAKANSTDTRHSFLPQIRITEQLNLSTDNSLAGSYLPFGITPATSAGIRNENTMQAAAGNLGVLYGEFTLINFGLNKAKLNTAETIVQFEEADYAREVYEAEFSVAKTFFQLLKVQNRLSVDRENVDRYQSVFNVIRALSLSGLIAGADSSLAIAELSKAKMNYNQSLGNLKQLNLQLEGLTGIPSSKIQLLQPTVNANILHPVYPNWLADSVSNPLIQYYQKQKEILEANERQIKKEYLPKIMLEGSAWARGSSIEYNDQFKSLSTGLGYQRFNYALGIGISYPLLNGLYKRDKLNINRYQLQASELQIQNQALVLKIGLSQAEAAMQTSDLNLLEMPTQLQAAQDIYLQKMAQYKAGIISLIDLTNASFVLYRSQTDYLDVVTDWYLAQLGKAAYAGTLEQFIQTIK